MTTSSAATAKSLGLVPLVIPKSQYRPYHPGDMGRDQNGKEHKRSKQKTENGSESK